MPTWLSKPAKNGDAYGKVIQKLAMRNSYDRLPHKSTKYPFFNCQTWEKDGKRHFEMIFSKDLWSIPDCTGVRDHQMALSKVWYSMPSPNLRPFISPWDMAMWWNPPVSPVLRGGHMRSHSRGLRRSIIVPCVLRIGASGGGMISENRDH